MVNAGQAAKSNEQRLFGLLFELLSQRSAMGPNSTATPETIALARQILRSIYPMTEGRYQAQCRLGSIPGATTAAVIYAVRKLDRAKDWLRRLPDG